ncbi:MAG: hypothetical protein U1D30_13455 [Planctomycetota bacterium]
MQKASSTLVYIGVLIPAFLGLHRSHAESVIHVTRPFPAPEWALLERELFRANVNAVREFYSRYFDAQGYLLCVERWGGDDGPDDAIECAADWPLLFALGADSDTLRLYRKAWEGHLRQYTLAKTSDVELARDGMYYKEFPVMFDWVHHGEGLQAFLVEGLADPGDESYGKRVRRFAGFYLNEDPKAANYDPKRKIIRSLFNGSRGPLLRKATALDWAGDPIEIEGRFQPRHGEKDYAEMLEHFKDYTDVVGDHPQNLCATSLVLCAFALTGESKYRDWILEYVDAWGARAKANGDILPSNVGLDGTIGGSADGKWYGGVYGWGFTVHDPASGKLADRNTHHLGLSGFGNALMASGEMRFVGVWRRQIEAVNAQGKRIDGVMKYPRMYGDNGWYGYVPEPYAHGAEEVYYWSQEPSDATRLAAGGWREFLGGKNPDYPRSVLRRDLERIRLRVAAMRADVSTPDTRLADDPLMVTPAAADALVELTLGGMPPRRTGSVLHSRVRYFDPKKRRAGLPQDVAALVEGMSADTTTVTLVNVNVVESREVFVQSGAFAEHQCETVNVAGRSYPIEGRGFLVRLAPGAGETFVLRSKRFANAPTLKRPWDDANAP